MEFVKDVDFQSHLTSNDFEGWSWNMHFSEYSQVILVKSFNDHTWKNIAIELYIK